MLSNRRMANMGHSHVIKNVYYTAIKMRAMCIITDECLQQTKKVAKD